MQRPRRSLRVAVSLVFVLHSALQFVLYREQVVDHWPLVDSERIQIGVPLALAMSSFAVILSLIALDKPWPPAVRVGEVLAACV